MKEAFHWVNHMLFVPLVVAGVVLACIPFALAVIAVVAHDRAWHFIHDLGDA
jgi:hypothetical protein